MPAQDVSITLIIPTPNEAMDGAYGTREVNIEEWQITLAIYAALRDWHRTHRPEVYVNLTLFKYTTADYDLMVMHFYRRGWIVSPYRDTASWVTVKEARKGVW